MSIVNLTKLSSLQPRYTGIHGFALQSGVPSMARWMNPTTGDLVAPVYNLPWGGFVVVSATAPNISTGEGNILGGAVAGAGLCLPANFLRAGSIIRGVVSGVFTGTQNGIKTLNLYLKLGVNGTTADSAFCAFAHNGTSSTCSSIPWKAVFECNILTAGASATCNGASRGFTQADGAIQAITGTSRSQAVVSTNTVFNTTRNAYLTLTGGFSVAAGTGTSLGSGCISYIEIVR